MAFQKKTDLHNGYSADYWKLAHREVSEDVGRAYGVFKVYSSRDFAQKGGRAADTRIASILLEGADFDKWFGVGRDPAANDQEIFYNAAAELGVVSDFGGVPDPADKTIKPGHRPLFKNAESLREDLKDSSKKSRTAKK